jgi:hypothetical protein
MACFQASKSALVGCSHEKVLRLCPGIVKKIAGSTLWPSAQRMSAREWYSVQAFQYHALVAMFYEQFNQRFVSLMGRAKKIFVVEFNFNLVE